MLILLYPLSFTVIFAAILAVKPFHSGPIGVFDNIASLVGPVVLLPFAFGWIPLPGQPRHIRDAGARRLPVLFLALGVTTDVLGQAIWTFYALVLHQPVPFPSLDDVSYLLTYPLLLTGILLIPARGTSILARSKAAVHGLIIMVAAFTFSWFFVLGPTVLQGGESVLAKFVGTAYPMGDLLLIGALLVLALRSANRPGHLVTLTLFTGLSAMVVADYMFDIQTLHGTYQTGQVLDVLWPAADMMIAASAIMIRYLPLHHHVAGARGADVATNLGDSKALGFASYLLIPAVGALDTTLLIVRGDNRLMPGVVIGSICLVALIMLQHMLETSDNVTLSRRLQENNRQLKLVNEKLHDLATSDPLTNIPNHRGMVDALEREILRAHRYGRSLVVLFIDIDHFKAVNDSQGHAVGDSVLEEFAKIARKCLRTCDAFGRWGGEEFLALLPETDYEQGIRAAERFRVTVAESKFTSVTNRNVTCSIGVSAYPDDGATASDLVSQADHAMYAAKRLGRNQTRSARDGEVYSSEPAGNFPSTRQRAGMMATVEALFALVDGRDHYTALHSEEVASLSRSIATAMGLSSDLVRVIDLAARLHDIGKVAVPDAVLLKPGQLTDDEWRLIHAHPRGASEVLASIPHLEGLAPVVRAHHERFSGHGYPDGLSGSQIPIASRILAVADAFAAMTSDRPYQRPRSVGDALSEMVRCAGDQFDPHVVGALRRVVRTSVDRVA